MSDEQDKLKVSLEPPKLFGRKKKADAPSKAASAPAAEETPAADEPAADEPEVLEPTTEDTAEVEAAAEEPSADTAVIDVPAEAEPAPTTAPAPQQPAPTKPAQKKPAQKKPVAAKSPAAKTAPPAPAPVKKSADEPEAAPAAAVAKKTTRPRARLAPAIEPEPVRDADLEDAAIADQSDEDDGPLLDMYPAAAVTGVVVGAVMVLLTWLSLRGCEAVRGTSSCGGGPGFILLVATFVLCILLGSTLLRTFQIPDPGSSSFLAVGLVAVVALLFLIDVLDHWSMIIVIPVLSIGAYLASIWVTKTFVEPGEA